MTKPSSPSRARADATHGFRHEALLYAGEDELVERVGTFVRDGLDRGEPALVVVGPDTLALLREELGVREGLLLADMADLGANPARLIPAWRRFVDGHAGEGTLLRGVGEPIVAERAPEALAECELHEGLMNVAFADAGPFWLVCPYDTGTLSDAVLDEALCNHPFVVEGGAHRESDSYRGLDALRGPHPVSLTAAPEGAIELLVATPKLEPLRRAVAERAAAAGVDRARSLELVVAVNELAGGAIAAGAGPAIVRLWDEVDRFVCEVADRLPVGHALAGRRLPGDGGPGELGLWLANQLCDLVQVRATDAGRLVRLHVAKA